jgi:integrase/recombinase XerD
MGAVREDAGLGLDPWDDPQGRKALVQEALERGDRGVLVAGMEAFVRRRGRKGDYADRVTVEAFLFFLQREGRRWPRLEPGDLKAFLRELLTKGNPLAPSPRPYQERSLIRVVAALRLFARFLDWAGVGWPEGLEWPDRPGEPARVDLALPEADYGRLLRAVPTFPVAHHRPFLQALIPFLGETGLDYRETVGLWRQDYRGESLLVRGRRAREVPLSPEAREALEAWLPLRDYLASLHPIPYPHLFLRTSEGPERGKPWSLGALVPLVRALFKHAGLDHVKNKPLALRYRAVRRLIGRGYPKEKVAYFVGIKRVAQGWE